MRKVMSGTSDANMSFKELCNLLDYLGFEERIKGSHHILRREGVIDKTNLQKSSSQAKPYYVKQVRKAILRNNLGETDE